MNLYKEWQIWSQCFGKVLVLTGVSSSGKTTFLKQKCKNSFHIISQDDVYDSMLLDHLCKNTKMISLVEKFVRDNDLMSIMYGFKIKTKYAPEELKLIKDLRHELSLSEPFTPTELEICDQMYKKSKQFIFSGQNVVLDVVALEEKIQILSYSFHSYPMKIWLFYAPLEKTLQQCFQRNSLSFQNIEFCDQRDPGMILYQYAAFFEFKQKSNLLKLDTCLEKIDKDSTKKIVEATGFYQELLFLSKKPFILDYHVLIPDVMERTYSLVKLLLDKLSLENNESIYVVPTTTYDFIYIINGDSPIDFVSPASDPTIKRAQDNLDLSTVVIGDTYRVFEDSAIMPEMSMRYDVIGKSEEFY